MNISVVIPTYNRYSVLIRALDSVYSQTHQPSEVIVVDDGSNDETHKIVEHFPQIKYYYQENSGVSSARNFGIKKSISEWIAFLDSDDEWHEDKLKEHAELHTQNSELLISYTDEKWIRDNKEIKVPKKYQKHAGDIFKECLSHCFIAPSATIVHKNLLDEVGLFDEDLEVCEDYDLWLRVSKKYEIGLVEKKLITKHGGDEDQLSVKHWGMDRFRVQSLEKLLNSDISLAQTEYVKSSLKQKYELLLKGAVKYEREEEAKAYRQRLQALK